MVKQLRRSEMMRQVYEKLAPSLKYVVFFSVITNVMMLVPSLYMFQVYGRVVDSRNTKTLLMLTLLVFGAYVLLEVLEWVKKQVMLDASHQFDRMVRATMVEAMFTAQRYNMGFVGKQAMQDFKALQEFMVSPVFFSFIDAPLAVITLVILFFMSPLLGWFSVFGALILLVVGFFNATRIHKPLQSAQSGALEARAYGVNMFQNAPVVASMGMFEHVKKEWLKLQQSFIAQQAEASTYAGNNTAFSKMLQNLLSSLTLGLGAWLALRGEMGGDMMIVGSILAGRLLAPTVMLIAGWRQVDTARESYMRFESLLETFPLPQKSMSLPAPEGRLTVEMLAGGPPRTNIQIIKGVTFGLQPGSSLAIVGPSASGKTSLSKFLVGLWQPMNGSVRLDGGDIYHWNKAELGPHIGYLPQRIELLDGTLAENIARFGDVDEGKVSDACRLVGLEGFVESLPNGYSTQIGLDGAYLSGGQRQRVALARAVYGVPKLIVLDEPNSSLDEAGDTALLETLKALKRFGSTVIVITHRNNILSLMDFMMILHDGKVLKMGKTEEVLAQLQSPAPDGNNVKMTPQTIPGKA